jgi:hypothetical protein
MRTAPAILHPRLGIIIWSSTDHAPRPPHKDRPRWLRPLGEPGHLERYYCLPSARAPSSRDPNALGALGGLPWPVRLSGRATSLRRRSLPNRDHDLLFDLVDPLRDQLNGRINSMMSLRPSLTSRALYPSGAKIRARTAVGLVFRATTQNAPRASMKPFLFRYASPRRLQHGPKGDCLEAPRSRLWRWQVRPLGQD